MARSGRSSSGCRNCTSRSCAAETPSTAPGSLPSTDGRRTHARDALMRVVIAPNAFKGSLSALDAAEAIAEGVRVAAPDADLVLVPIADGGDGTVDALVAATQGERRSLRVRGPPGDPVDAGYGLIDTRSTALIEMAKAAGLALVPPAKRDPRITTTYGVGELLHHAHDAGARHFIVGIGGSATNDGGAGMAQALGHHLLDAHGHEPPAGGPALKPAGPSHVRGAPPNAEKPPAGRRRAGA